MGTTARTLPPRTIEAIDQRVDRLVQRVIRDPAPVTTSSELDATLAAARSHDNSAASMTSLLAATRFGRRTVRVGARRIPVLAAVTGSAAALGAVAAGMRELRAIASYLVHRARAGGVPIHPPHLRSVVLQLYLDPDVSPSLDAAPRSLVRRLATRWARSAAAESLPLVPDVARPSVRRWVSAVDLVDLRLLEPRDGPPALD